MNSFNHSGRQCGKSVAAERLKEFALDAGKTVLCSNPYATTIQRRYGHLTSIETLPEGILGAS